MALDLGAAKAAIAKVGRAIGLSPEDGAKGIIDIANEVMLGALRVITVQRGLDPRDFGIVAFGGAGPLHANALAELLGCYPVLVPPSPASCRLLASSKPNSRMSSCRLSSAPPSGSTSQDVWSALCRVERKSEDMARRAGSRTAVLEQSPIPSIYVTSSKASKSLLKPPPNSWRHPGQSTRYSTRFHETHQRLYGVRFHVPVELVALRVVATGATPKVDEAIPSKEPADLASALIEKRPSYFNGAWVDTPNYDRTKLGSCKNIRPGDHSPSTTRPRSFCQHIPPSSTTTAIC